MEILQLVILPTEVNFKSSILQEK